MKRILILTLIILVAVVVFFVLRKGMILNTGPRYDPLATPTPTPTAEKQ